ncbi:MAG: CMP-N-acetlyneuraminic acid synthetase [Omnitrophica WOR_2 bacterium RIFCSPLOWO2_02_FULL_50_19]|nr:MAG: CMP-N-acetlyneuraminic acid synthetase [Omnitrophica WOR_2 bacterium RIFCSPLOWO2_02_FULL_50_19]
MYKGKTILALIPARGGSKGVPRKNIRRFFGKPLIAWAIKGARNSKYVDRVVVSTDDKEIAAVSRRFLAETPFLRVKRLATSRAKGIDVVLDAIDRLERRGERYDLVILLQPTSPLRVSKDIDQAIEFFFEKKAKSVISVCRMEHNPRWSNILPKDGCMKDFIPGAIMNKVRQEFPVYYRLTGAIFLASADYLKVHKTFYGKNAYAYIMPQGRSVDIDNEIDFAFAEYLYKNRGKTGLKHAP